MESSKNKERVSDTGISCWFSLSDPPHSAFPNCQRSSHFSSDGPLDLEDGFLGELLSLTPKIIILGSSVEDTG